ncbi:MAG: PQQ-binding-like beta-propeller repeat protein [Pyrinomonadaceae bacterium]|nr:PQQ-binding-like beta-propeller repeat protein [Pyrinomonadaceae bacterium]
MPNTDQHLAIINHHADWPQWGGPNRDFKSDSKKLANRWPAAGPRRLWVRPLGEGHSSIVSETGRLYTMYRRGAREYLICLEARSGKTLWEHAYAAPLYPKMDMSYGSGPHSTPVVSGELIFSVGTTGKLLCLDKTTGKEVWSHDSGETLGALSLTWGTQAAPLPTRTKS